MFNRLLLHIVKRRFIWI